MDITTQKIGTLDKKKLQLLLKSFSDEDCEESSEQERTDTSFEQLTLKDTNNCRFCGKFTCIADTDYGAYVCTSCGKKNGDILDNAHEWRPLGYDDPRRSDPSRVGMPVNEHFIKASLSTSINGWGNQMFRQFHKYNSMDYDERSLLRNFQHMDSSTDDIVPEAVKDHAKNLYKKISENENKRGAKKHSNMAACVYFASEGRNCATDIEKISSQFNIKKKKFTKGCNFYREQLFEKEPQYYARMKPVSAEDEIKKICSSLGIEEVYVNICCYVAHMAQELGIVIKNTPLSIAVGSVYLVCTTYGLEYDKKDISDKCEISDVTVNKSFNLLAGYKNLLIPTKKLFDKYMEVKTSECK
jgi:transcription initiation factor TFIIIB Brf1 subunit/transcription initiation factor TFIIB